MLLDDVAAQSGASSRRLYSYLSGSDNDDDGEMVEAGRGRRGRRRGDWRAGEDDDDDDGLSSPSWVRSGTGSESDTGADDDGGTTRRDAVGGRVVDGAFGVYSRINNLGTRYL